jgi:3-deoxy-D-arabino-heptulosonate 7-phosphate (DAHP) synthase
MRRNADKSGLSALAAAASIDRRCTASITVCCGLTHAIGAAMMCADVFAKARCASADAEQGDG